MFCVKSERAKDHDDQPGYRADRQTPVAAPGWHSVEQRNERQPIHVAVDLGPERLGIDQLTVDHLKAVAVLDEFLPHVARHRKRIAHHRHAD